MKSPKGTLVAKAIDADAAMFESSVLQQLELESGNKKECTQDEDCSIFRCESSCDRDTGTCSGKLLSTNLVVRTCVMYELNLIEHVQVLFMSQC